MREEVGGVVPACVSVSVCLSVSVCVVPDFSFMCT